MRDDSQMDLVKGRKIVREEEFESKGMDTGKNMNIGG